MNKVLLIGRATDIPDVKYNGELAIAKYTLAVERRFKKDAENGADFIRCVAFGKSGQWAEKYLTKGKKIAIEGRIQTGSYENKKGEKVYTTDIIVENQEFVESKSEERVIPQATPGPVPDDGFMKVPEGTDDSGLPFNF